MTLSELMGVIPEWIWNSVALLSLLWMAGLIGYWAGRNEEFKDKEPKS